MQKYLEEAGVDFRFHTEVTNVIFEFKNGKINDKQKYNVYQKIYESLLIFCDITGESISFCRDHAEFILVYNETKMMKRKKKGKREDYRSLHQG